MQQANELARRLFMRKLPSKNLDHVISGFEANQGHGQDVTYRTGRICKLIEFIEHLSQTGMFVISGIWVYLLGGPSLSRNGVADRPDMAIVVCNRKHTLTHRLTHMLSCHCTGQLYTPM